MNSKENFTPQMDIRENRHSEDECGAESQPLVSVIVPVYNVKPYLAETLGSVVCQSYPNLEIIIIDDGSTDGSGAICDEFAAKDDRVKVTHHQKNKGVSAARNAGLDASSGEYIAFLDSDDAFCEHAIETLLSAMLSKDIDLVAGRYTSQRTDGQLKAVDTHARHPVSSAGLYDHDDAIRALAGGIIQSVLFSKLYRRHLWGNIRFPDGQIYEDTYTFCHIIDRCEHVFILDEVVYKHRYRKGSITNTWTRKELNDWYLARYHYYEFFSKFAPSVISGEQLMNIRRDRIYRLFFLLAQCSASSHGEDADVEKEIRAHIMEEVNDAGLKQLGLQIQKAYILFRISPTLLRFAIFLARFFGKPISALREHQILHR